MFARNAIGRVINANKGGTYKTHTVANINSIHIGRVFINIGSKKNAYILI